MIVDKAITFPEKDIINNKENNNNQTSELILKKDKTELADTTTELADPTIEYNSLHEFNSFKKADIKLQAIGKSKLGRYCIADNNIYTVGDRIIKQFYIDQINKKYIVIKKNKCNTKDKNNCIFNIYLNK